MPSREPVTLTVRQMTSLGSAVGVLSAAASGAGIAEINPNARSANFFMALLPSGRSIICDEGAAPRQARRGSSLRAEMPLWERPAAGLDEQLDRRLMERGGELKAGPALL